jgi:hypothetical protein
MAARSRSSAARGPPVIRFTAQHEFDFVLRVEMGKVGPQVFATSPEPGVLMSVCATPANRPPNVERAAGFGETE